MRIVPALAALMLAVTPALAEGEIGRGSDLMQEGAKLLFRGLMGEMEPAMRKMDEIARILGEIDEYQPPEVLPNGDILIRRKTPLRSSPGSLDRPAPGEIDL